MSDEGAEVYENQEEDVRVPRSTSDADNVEESSQASTGKISKRKRSSESDDEEDTNLETKKPKSEGNSSSGANAITIISQTDDMMLVEIPHDKVGSIIGTKGMIIQDIQARTGCQAKVNQDFPAGVPRQMEFRGNKATMTAGLELVKRILEFGPASIHANTMFGGPQITTMMDCPITIVGKVIGTGGQTIKEIQSKSGAKVQIHQDFPPEQPRKLEITGSASAVGSAVQMIQTIMTGGNINGPSNTPRGTSGSAPQHNSFGQQGHTPRGGQQQQQQQQQHHHHHHHNPPPIAAPPAAPMVASYPAAGPAQPDISIVIEVSKTLVGKIIGKGGENIVNLQRKSGCRIVVDQQVPEGYPCRVNVTGIPYNVDLARKLVEEIQMGVHTSKVGASLPPPIAAGSAAPAAPPAAPQAVYGGYPMPAYGMPPTAMPAQPPAYGAYGAYPSAPPAVAGYPYAQPAAAAPAPYGYPQYAHPAAAQTQPHQHHHAAPRATAAPAVAAHKPAPAPQPSANVWTEYKDEEGRSYWYNSATGVSQWEPPSYKK